MREPEDERRSDPHLCPSTHGGDSARAALALDLAGIGTWCHDLTQDVVSFDRRGAFHHGLEHACVPVAEVLGRIHPDDRARVEATIGDARASRAPPDHHLEYRVVLPFGATRWLSSVVRIDFEGPEAARRAARAFGVTQDVTRAKRTEAALRESEERFRILLEHAADAVFVIDGEGRFRNVNASACERLGFSRDELLAMNVADIDPALRLEEARPRWASFRSGEHYHLVARHRRKNGTTLPVEIRSSIVTIRGAKLIVAIARDVTERVEAERELRRLAAAVEQTPASIVISDASGVVEYVNPAFEAVSGYRRAEVVGRHTNLLRSGKHDEAFYRSMWSTISAGRVWQGQIVNRAKDGRSFTEDVVIAPVRDEAGAVRNYVAVKRDITKELALRESLADAQRLETVGRLAGGVAHDFNNLLTVLLSTSEAIRDDVASGHPVRIEDVDEIRVAGRRAADLTRKLLAFARKQVIAPTALDLNSVVCGAETLIRRAMRTDVQLTFELAPDLWTTRCDRVQVEQVLLNLTVNAMDAMPHGGAFTIATRNVSAPRSSGAGVDDLDLDWATLDVSDTGEGFSEDARAHLFEPFFTTKPQGKGTGLGLATVYGIVHQVGGEILVDSTVGRGSRFELRFPRYAGPLETPAGDPVAGTCGGTETILVVEDDAPVREVIVRALRAGGYDVHDAATGASALELVNRVELRPALLVTDVVMPDMNGQRVADEIRRLRPEVGILFVSGYTQEIIERHGVLNPGVEFLPKPFTQAALLDKVRHLIQQRA